MCKTISSTFVFIVMTLLLCAGTAGAVDKTFKKADKQIYLGASFAYNTVGGDFDADHVLANGSETILLPEIKGGAGFGLTAGVSGKFTPVFHYSAEMVFSRTTHEYEFPLLTKVDDATVMIIDFNFKGVYGAEKIQPYMLLGFSVPYINVKNAASDGTFVEDAKYSGIGVNLGAGADLYVSPRVFLNFNLMYRLQ
ncbi:MAG: hypothetical protein CVT49_01430 [candidate division Zixibacteria bacterium HGW-Zixibacteria-1]|nr:MAG: hypothetical protein CVT49_01430 [candidate division Zixibacteria bacterium HGW-Zixibacteria-1]